MNAKEVKSIRYHIPVTHRKSREALATNIAELSVGFKAQ